VKRILMKLHLRDRIQVVIFAYETGLNTTPSKSPPRTPNGRVSG
jgi:hypothetical protein